jgi:uncharacterized membrane protein YccC
MPISKAERQFHRKTAARCFNRTWDYLEKKDRSLEDDRQMLHLAHTSRFHWSLVGNARNQAVGDWQVSRVYACLNQPSLALQFARASLETCKKNDLVDLTPTANEAMARAYAVAKDYSNARRFLVTASNQLHKLEIADEDKRTYQSQISETEKMIEG